MFRKNKALFGFVVGVVALLAIAATILGSHQLAGQLAKKDQSATTKTQCSSGQATTNHHVVIQNDITTPSHITAPRCDTLTITNQDNAIRLISFGLHDEHIHYDGVEQKTLKKGESFTIALSETGEFLFHDHDQDEVGGTFTVTEN